MKDKTVLRQIKDWVEITTPYLDRHNDYLQIYVKRDNSGFILTADGTTSQYRHETTLEMRQLIQWRSQEPVVGEQPEHAVNSGDNFLVSV